MKIEVGMMKNITLAVDEELLKAGREYARKHRTTLNALVRRLLAQTVSSGRRDWLDECFAVMDRSGADSKGARWDREDLYNV
jgi:ribonuclease D